MMLNDFFFQLELKCSKPGQRAKIEHTPQKATDKNNKSEIQNTDE